MARRRRSLGDLTQEQRQEIADAPQVAPSPYAAPCTPEPPPQLCPAQIASPGWGDARTWYPPSGCPGVIQQAEGIAWWKLLLIAVGGVIAVREVMSE